MTIAPSQPSFVLPEIASAEGAFAASLAKAATAKPSAAGVGKSDIGMQYDVDRFMRNYSGFYATFDKAQLYELCCYLSEVNHYSDTPLSYYDSAIYESKTGVAGAIKSVTDMLASKGHPWTGLTVADRMVGIQKSFHAILNNRIANEYSGNFSEMLDGLSRLMNATPAQAAAIYKAYPDFLNRFNHIVLYYNPGYSEKYTRFQLLINNYSEETNKTPNYATRQLLSSFTSDGHHMIRTSGGIWNITGGPNTGIHFTAPADYSKANKCVDILKHYSKNHLLGAQLSPYTDNDINNAFELLGISNRQIEIYAKSAAIGHVGASVFQPRTSEGVAAFEMLKIARGMRNALALSPECFRFGRQGTSIYLMTAEDAMRKGIIESNAFILPDLAMIGMQVGFDPSLLFLADMSHRASIFGVWLLGYDIHKQDTLAFKALSETNCLLTGRGP